MYQLKINGKYDYSVERDNGKLLINDGLTNADIKQVNGDIWHVIDNLHSYNAEVVSFDRATKTAVIKVNNNTYTITAKDRFDLLLDKMGLSNLNTAKISELKAPMPGLVLKILTEEGATVAKGDNLFILEAMKMENIIKAPTDAVVRQIKVKPGDKVEKGQILLHVD